MKRLFIIFGFFLLLFTPIACKSSSPKAAVRICDNLIEAEFIKSADCTTSQIYSEFIPHYFHVNEATFDYVSIGMQGFEKISFYENNEGCLPLSFCPVFLTVMLMLPRFAIPPLVRSSPAIPFYVICICEKYGRWSHHPAFH